MKAPNRRKKDHNPIKMFAVLGAVGVDFAMCVVAGYYVGIFMESRFGHVLWLLGGLFLGIAAGVWSVAVIIKKFLGE